MRLSHLIIFEVARKYLIDPALLIKPCRRRAVVVARIEVTKRLFDCGYSPTRIARCLSHNHTTICFYLGRTKKKAKVQRPVWRRPIIRNLRYCKRIVDEPLPSPPKPHLYLKPYAGADPETYHWRERRA